MKPLLLFVGSTPSTTELLQHLFSSRYRTATYNTPAEALAYLDTATERPTVVICDQSEPNDTTPVELFRGLKNDHKNDTLPTVVLCSDCHSADNTTQLDELNWTEKICKPFNPEHLSLRVRQLLPLHQ